MAFADAGVVIVPTHVRDQVHYGVFCEAPNIAKGTRFGPFSGKVVNMSEIKTYDDNTYMWEVSGGWVNRKTKLTFF